MHSVKTGTVAELRLAARILRKTDCRDPDLTVRLHEMARLIEAMTPGLSDGNPIDPRLHTLARLLNKEELKVVAPPALDFD